MAPSTPKKRSRPAKERSLERTSSPSLPTPPKTPRSNQPDRATSKFDSKASRALQRLKDKLLKRSRSSESPGNATGSLLPAPEISSPVSPSRPAKKRKVDSDRTKPASSKPLVPGEVIEISSDDTDKRKQQGQDDKPFRGRHSRSRVQTSSPKKASSPLRTRGFYRRRGTSLDAHGGDDGVNAESGERDVTPAPSETDEDLRMEPIDALFNKKKGKQPATTVTSDSEDFSAGEYDSQDSFIDDRPNDNDEEEEYPSDEESRLQLAMVQSIVTAMSPNLPRDRYNKIVRDATEAVFEKHAAKKHGRPKHSSTRNGSKATSTSKAASAQRPDEHMEEAFYESSTDDGDDEEAGTASGSSSNTMSTSAAGTAPMTMSAFMAAAANPPVTPTATQASNAALALVPATPTAALVPVPPTPTGGQVTAAGPVAGTPGQPLTFGALLANNPGAGGGPTDVKYLQRVKALPATLGVDCIDQRDPILAGDYGSLCNLEKGTIKPWTNTRGRPRLPLGHWGKTIPNMSATLALAILRFQHVGEYINPSRISPLEVELREYPTTPPRYHVVRNRKVVYMVSLGAVSRSHLLSRSSAGMQQRYITWRGVPYEWDRMEGWVCMVSGHNPIGGQYGMNSLQASTKSDYSKGDKTTPIYTDEWTIDSDDEVPIYDARNAPEFDFMAHVSDIDNRLPRWNVNDGEIPRDSCVAVAYTMSIYYSSTSEDWNFGCNVRWVLVLGVPGSV